MPHDRDPVIDAMFDVIYRSLRLTPTLKHNVPAFTQGNDATRARMAVGMSIQRAYNISKDILPPEVFSGFLRTALLTSASAMRLLVMGDIVRDIAEAWPEYEDNLKDYVDNVYPKLNAQFELHLAEFAYFVMSMEDCPIVGRQAPMQ